MCDVTYEKPLNFVPCFNQMKHIEELLEELGPGEPEDTNEGEEEEEENWETDEEDMDQN